MPRKKSTKVETPTNEVVEDSPVTTSFFKRDENGLIDGVDYIFDEQGFVNWRAMIKPEHLFVNKDWFESREKEIPKSIDGLEDSQILIKLAGIKDLARLRGYKKVSYQIERCELDHVHVQCTIEFIPNFETNNESVTFSSIANATVYNTDNFGTRFLDPICENRAFIRCVRNFLGIHIAGDEEIDKSNSSKNILEKEMATTGGVVEITPHETLKKHLFSKYGCNTFSGFLDILRNFWEANIYRNEETKNWEKFEDLSAKDCRVITTIVKKQKV